MANNKTAENGRNDRTTAEKDLQKQLEQLRGEIAGITSTLTDLGSSKLNEAKHKAEKFYTSAKENSEEIVSQAKEKLDEFESYMNHCVRKNPGKSVLFAASIGFILAQLLRR
ncbi:hypothetical protein BAnh1_11300 [Bartonella australis AUST/NH1]|uniref:DUF883 domain-containing protein n=1 Tax=Bartonella australis (strain Aust/NH1) TaxID=1094489 RepID=M1NUS2_BARAA|nr:DUF883 family protein [Bartonella australis]AGF74998.1 hypothetical protein BAnh1_11300 [Bartonella australis AUST/NH1]